MSVAPAIALIDSPTRLSCEFSTSDSVYDSDIPTYHIMYLVYDTFVGFPPDRYKHFFLVLYTSIAMELSRGFSEEPPTKKAKKCSLFQT